MTDKKHIPNPGSTDAIELGCSCPVLDNAHGIGCGLFDAINGAPLFWINEECPLHGKQIPELAPSPN